MNRSRHLLAALLVSTWAGAACSFQHSGPTSPSVPAVTASSGSSAPSLLGVWTSEGASARTSSVVVMRPNADTAPTCTGWTWNITNQSSSEVDGNFTATCLAAFALGGQAVGTLTSANAVTISATGSGTAPNVSGACSFSLDAQGTFDGDTLHATYTAHTCLGNFTGAETLRRNAIPGLPGPPPAPEPPPPPPPPSDPPPPAHEAWEDCGALGDHQQIVECVHDWVNPGASGTLAFEVTKRVAWLLRGEGAGLLIKEGGENIISWQGHSFSISRICYPDGHIYKVISDAGDGGTNGATWADNGFVDPGLYLAAIDPRIQ